MRVPQVKVALMIKEVEASLPGWISCTRSAGKKRSAIIAEDVLWV